MLIVDSQIHIWENAKMSGQHRQIPTYLRFLSDADKELVMGRALCQWIGWSLRRPSPEISRASSDRGGREGGASRAIRAGRADNPR